MPGFDALEDCARFLRQLFVVFCTWQMIVPIAIFNAAERKLAPVWGMFAGLLQGLFGGFWALIVLTVRWDGPARLVYGAGPSMCRSLSVPEPRTPPSLDMASERAVSTNPLEPVPLPAVPATQPGVHDLLHVSTPPGAPETPHGVGNSNTGPVPFLSPINHRPISPPPHLSPLILPESYEVATQSATAIGMNSPGYVPESEVAAVSDAESRSSVVIPPRNEPLDIEPLRMNGKGKLEAGQTMQATGYIKATSIPSSPVEKPVWEEDQRPSLFKYIDLHRASLAASVNSDSPTTAVATLLAERGLDSLQCQAALIDISKSNKSGASTRLSASELASAFATRKQRTEVGAFKGDAGEATYMPVPYPTVNNLSVAGGDPEMSLPTEGQEADEWRNPFAASLMKDFLEDIPQEGSTFFGLAPAPSISREIESSLYDTDSLQAILKQNKMPISHIQQLPDNNMTTPSQPEKIVRRRSRIDAARDRAISDGTGDRAFGENEVFGSSSRNNDD